MKITKEQSLNVSGNGPGDVMSDEDTFIQENLSQLNRDFVSLLFNPRHVSFLRLL